MISKTLEELTERMRNCYQFKNVSMLDHGEMVHEAYNKLIAQLNGGEVVVELPPLIQEIYANTKQILADSKRLYKYHLFHDCGKPACQTIDAEGKKHYPNHAEWSKKQYIEIFGSTSIVPELIGADMDFHNKSGKDLEDLWKSPLAPTLYFTAWAEIIANSSMFGGQDSTSFKIKKKRLIQAGKKCSVTQKMPLTIS